MRRRDVDQRPPVEVLGSEAPEGSVQRVEVGGGRASRGTGLLVGMAVLAVLVVGLTQGGQDDDPSPPTDERDRDGNEQAAKRKATATTRPRATTTTSLPAPLPLMPGVDIRILLIRQSGPDELLDLGTGETVGVDIGRDVHSSVPVRGGVVVVESPIARYRELPFGKPVDLGEADQVLPGGDDSSVWLLRDSYDAGVGPVAVRVDLAGQVLSGPVGLDEGWIVGASRSGLIAQAGGRIYEVQQDGAIRPIVSGEALGVSEGRLLARVCDDRAACRMEVWDAALRTSRALDVPRDAGRHYGATLSVQPGGSRALLQLYGPGSSPDLVLVDLDGGPPVVVDDVLMLGMSSAVWLPGDLGVLLVKADNLVRVYERGDKVLVEDLHDRGGDIAVVIPR